jgi:hypothetical protein
MKLKSVMMVLMAVLGVLSAIGGSTGLQLLPMFVFVVWAYLDLRMKKDYSVAILVLALLMVIINVVVDDPSLMDIVVWAMVAFAWK